MKNSFILYLKNKAKKEKKLHDAQLIIAKKSN